MIDYTEILNEYIKETKSTKKELFSKTKDKIICRNRQILWLIYKSKSPYVRYKDIVAFMKKHGYDTTVSNIQQGVFKARSDINQPYFEKHKEIFDKIIGDV
jgi:hypothetical protein